MPELVFDVADLYESKTEHLTPPEGFRPYFSEMGLPRFGLRTVEWMRRDSQIKLGMGFHAAPLLKPKIDLSGDPQIVQFVVDTIKKLWHRAVPKIVEALWYTACGGEVLYERDEESGLVQFRDFLPVYPADISILYKGSKKWGIKLRRVQIGSNTELTEAEKKAANQPIILGPIKSFLYVHKRRWGSWIGESELEGAYEPWLEKADKRGARHSRRLWFYKNAFGGGIIFHPPGSTQVRNSSGQIELVAYRDLARQAMERFANGGVWIFESTVDEKGNRNWDYQEPKINGDGKSLIEYIDTLDHEILRGMGIPDDVLQAVSGKDSLSGRSVPLQCFFISQSQTLMNIFDELKDQIIDPLLQINFGTNAHRRYHVEKIEVDADALMPSQPQQPGMPGQPGQPGQNPNDPNNPNPQQGQGPIVIGKPDEPAEFSQDDYGRPHLRLIDARHLTKQVTVFGDDPMASHPRAPVGGAIIKGRMFKGGEFIYKGDIEGLSKADLGTLAQATGHGTAENLLAAVGKGPHHGDRKQRTEQQGESVTGGREGSGAGGNAGKFSDVVGGRSGRDHATTQEMYARTRSMIEDEDNNRPLAIAREYNPAYQPMKDNPTSKERQAPIGQHYEMVGDPRTPDYQENEFEKEIVKGWNKVLDTKFDSYADLVDASYTTLGAEVLHQYNRLVDEGVQFDWHSDGSGDYADSMEMASDVHHNKHMHVYQGGEKHSFLGEEDEDGLSLNDKFRAVHDYFGHAVSGTSFGPKGEENAWASHVQMFSPLARVAMSSETRGQNSWVNYSGVNDEANALFKKAAGFRKAYDESQDPKLKELADKAAAEGRSKFKFAKQKSVVLPYEDLREGFEGFTKSFSEMFDAASHPRVPKGIKRGGLVIRGKEFTGGQFVYKSDLEGLSRPELEKLSGVLGVPVKQLGGSMATDKREHLAVAQQQLQHHTEKHNKLKAQNKEVPKELTQKIAALKGHSKDLNKMLADERQEALNRGLQNFTDAPVPRSALGPLRNPLPIQGTGENGDVTQFDISSALAENSRKQGGVLDIANPTHQDQIAEALAQEAEFAYNLDHNAKDWYARKIEEARATVSEIHPELKAGTESGDDHWGAFAAILAATSQGVDVTMNFEFADTIYKDWKANGFTKIDPTLFSSPKETSVRANLKLIQSLASRYGLNGMRKLMTQDMKVGSVGKALNERIAQGFNEDDPPTTIAELKADATGEKPKANPVSGEGSDEKLLGSMVLGPKIGSFYGNLMGRFHTVTMDLWFMRTIGRITGTLDKPNKESIKSNAQEILNAINDDNVRYHGMGRKTIAGHADKALRNYQQTGDLGLAHDHPLMQWAAKQHQNFKAGGYKERSDVHRAATALLHLTNHPEADPERHKLPDKEFKNRHFFDRKHLNSKSAEKHGTLHALTLLRGAVSNDPFEGHSPTSMRNELRKIAKTGNIEAGSPVADWLTSRLRRYNTGHNYYSNDLFGVASSGKRPMFADRSRLNRGVKNVVENAYSTMKQEAPKSSKQRQRLRTIVDKAQNILRSKGINLTNADMQAVVWYLEKDLYSRHGYTSPRGAATDYANAAKVLHAKSTGQELA